jgi:hypothetical protein
MYFNSSPPFAKDLPNRNRPSLHHERLWGDKPPLVNLSVFEVAGCTPRNVYRPIPGHVESGQFMMTCNPETSAGLRTINAAACGRVRQELIAAKCGHGQKQT